MGRVLITQLLTEVLIPRQLSTEAIRGWTRLFLRIILIRNANDLFRFRCFQIIWARKSSVNKCLCSHRLLLLIIKMLFHRIMITRLMWSRVWLYKMASGLEVCFWKICQVAAATISKDRIFKGTHQWEQLVFQLECLVVIIWI